MISDVGQIQDKAPAAKGEPLASAAKSPESTRKIKAIIQRLIGRLGFQLVRNGRVVDIQRRIEAATELEALYRQFVLPSLPVIAPENRRRYELLAQLQGTQLGEAIYLLDALHRSLPLEGAICEFGVAQGATSALIANEIRGSDKTLWLFDSFEGLPHPSSKDVLLDDIFNLGSIEKYAGTMAHGQGEVVSRLKAIDFPLTRVQLVAGFVEETMHYPSLPPLVCFAYVDFDFYEPIKIALDFLHPRLPVGANVVVDDYGWFSSGAQTAVDEFVAAHASDYVCSMPLPFAGRFAMLTKTSGKR